MLEIILDFYQLELQRTSSEWMIQRLYSEPATLRRLWLDSTTDSSDSLESDNNTTSALTFTFTLRRANVGVNFIFAIPLLGLLCLFMFFLVVVMVEGFPRQLFGCLPLKTELSSQTIRYEVRNIEFSNLTELITDKGSTRVLPNSNKVVDYVLLK